MRLDGKVAIVTGGAQGMGRAIALRLAREGAKVVVGDLQQEQGQKVAEEIKAAGGQAALLNCKGGDPLVKINRTARTHTGDVAEYRESYGLASSFRYQVEIN